MEDLYEVTIKLRRGDDLLAIDHRLGLLPGRETVKGLLGEAQAWFASLYGEEADERNVWVVRLDKEEESLATVSVE